MPCKKRKRKKGSVTLVFVIFITALIVVLISAFAAPMGVRINADLYRAGEAIMLDANESISEIENTTIRDSIQNIMTGGLDNVENNIEVGNALFQYGWILAVALTCIVGFLYTRRIVEYTGGGIV